MTHKNSDLVFPNEVKVTPWDRVRKKKTFYGSYGTFYSKRLFIHNVRNLLRASLISSGSLPLSLRYLVLCLRSYMPLQRVIITHYSLLPPPYSPRPHSGG
ncbi:hypothetical protein XENOCAPTIV_021846, partial [Xenoophorus captivus]